MKETPQQIKDFINDYKQAEYHFVNKRWKEFIDKRSERDWELWERPQRICQFEKAFLGDFVRNLRELSQKHNEVWRIAVIDKYFAQYIN